MTEQPTKKCPTAVMVFAWLIIISTLVHMHTLLFDYGWYRSNYNYWPDWLFNLRYAFSWFQRFLGLYIGYGFLLGRRLARQLAYALGTFTILTLYWKHHYPAFLRHCEYLDQIYPYVFRGLGYPELSFRAICLPALILHCLFDVIFWVSLFYVLSLPAVKRYFQDN